MNKKIEVVCECTKDVRLSVDEILQHLERSGKVPPFGQFFKLNG